MQQKPDYGLDAPGAIYKLLIIGILLIAASSIYPLLSRHYPLVWLLITIGAAVVGVSLILTGLMMIFSSKVGKIKEREHILNLLSIKGNENILDVGCGRGLYLVGAAKRLPSGKATGIDLWRGEDLSGNHQGNTMNNAVIEGVDDRIEIETADMRRMPFRDDTFELVLSCFAIHNIHGHSERRKALLEITRVLKPGGKLCIIDIQHIDEYINIFSENGITEIEKFKTKRMFPIATAIIGTKT